MDQPIGTVESDSALSGAMPNMWATRHGAASPALSAPLDIPVFILTRDSPDQAAHMVRQLQAWGVRTIAIVDRGSTAPEMLDFLDEVRADATVIGFPDSQDPRHFILSDETYALLPEVFGVTQAPFEFNAAMPKTFLSDLLELTRRHKVGKAGLALNLLDRHLMKPDLYAVDGQPYRIWEWESQYWTRPVEPSADGSAVFKADVDLSFALYNKQFFRHESFTDAVRVSGRYTCRHLSWYVDPLPATSHGTDYAYKSIAARRHGRIADRLLQHLSVGDLTVFVPPKGIDPRRLTRSDLYLDSETLDRHYKASAGPLGAVDPRWGSRFGRGVVKRLAGRLGRRLALALGIDAGTAAKAWFYPLWAEICVLLPARHLARHLARVAGTDLIVIPLQSTTFRYLGLWDANDVEPLYLGAALRQRCAHVVFVLADTAEVEAARRAGALNFTFVPHPWCLPAVAGVEPEPVDGSPRAVVVPSGIRGYQRLASETPSALTIACLFSQGAFSFDAALVTEATRPDTIVLPLTLQGIEDGETPLMLFAGSSAKGDLGDYFMSAVGGATKAAMERASRLADRHRLVEAHICDHVFFEAAIMADAVRQRGGTVVLWPHSANAVHVEMHDPAEIARIHCVTASAAAVWRAACPDASIDIDSGMMLSPCVVPRALTPSRPLTIVVIAGAHALGRLPLLDRRRHEDSYRQFFRGLASIRPAVRIMFKPKWTWETTAWMRDLVGPGVAFEETQLHPLHIDEPNMIFVTVSFGSTALLEGLGRGIPCLIVRDLPIEDYTGIDPGFIPIADGPTIIDAIGQFQDLDLLHALTRQELAWYARETHFPRFGRPGP